MIEQLKALEAKIVTRLEKSFGEKDWLYLVSRLTVAWALFSFIGTAWNSTIAVIAIIHKIRG